MNYIETISFVKVCQMRAVKQNISIIFFHHFPFHAQYNTIFVKWKDNLIKYQKPINCQTWWLKMVEKKQSWLCLVCFVLNTGWANVKSRAGYKIRWPAMSIIWQELFCSNAFIFLHMDTIAHGRSKLRGTGPSSYGIGPKVHNNLGPVPY